MSSDLLLEYLSLMVEKIHTKKGQKGAFGDKFDMNKFKSLKNYSMALAYAQQFLTMLGQGSSRAAFLLSGKYALKIALNDKGLGQNEAEVSVYTNPKSQPVVAKVYSSDPDYNWIVSDIVKPVKSVQEFEQLSGIDWRTFSDYINNNVKQKTQDKSAPTFVKAIINTAIQNGLLRGDLAQQDWKRDPTQDVMDHYGKTPDGRLVLLDYGFTDDVFSKHYASSKNALQGKTADTNAPTANRPVDDKTTGAPKRRAPEKSNVQVSDQDKTTSPRRKAVVDDPDKTGRLGTIIRIVGNSRIFHQSHDFRQQFDRRFLKIFIRKIKLL